MISFFSTKKNHPLYVKEHSVKIEPLYMSIAMSIFDIIVKLMLVIKL